MGNVCCRDDAVQSTELLQSGTNPNSKNVNSSDNKLSYIDSEGKPLPNAYRRFVKPPTTVGRQSLIVRKLHENDEVPDQMWVFDNNLLNSDYNKVTNNMHTDLKNRHTFHQIQGHYHGVKTVNLSKLNLQPKGILGSQKVAPVNNAFHSNSPGIHYTANPVSYQSSAFQNKNQTFQANPQIPMISQQELPYKRTISEGQVPVIQSINYNNYMTPRNYLGSNLVSVNNSVQHSASRQLHVIRQ